MKKACTFFVHGSRLESANAYLQNLAAQTKLGPAVNVGFLELGTPSLETAIEDHIKMGATQISILPLFLSPGRHLMHDVPPLVKEIQKKYPAVILRIETFLGEHPHFLDVITKWAHDCLQSGAGPAG